MIKNHECSCSKLLRVLFVTNIPSPNRVKFFNCLAKECDLTVVYERKTATDRDKNWKTESSQRYKEHYLKGIKYSNDASISFDIFRFLKRKQYDIVILSGYSSVTMLLAVFYMTLHKYPYILSTDGAFLHKENALKFRIKRYVIKNAYKCLSTGRSTDEFLIHYGATPNNICQYPFSSVYAGDMLETILHKEEKNQYKKLVGCKTSTMILSVGQPIHRKGFDVLIRAMRRIRSADVTVFIVGGTSDEECSALLKEQPDNRIIFIPFLTEDKLAGYYRAADVFILPTREDIWGLVINEAMSYALPVVTTNLCNAGLEMVKDGENGYIVPVEDDELLAKKVDSILDLVNSQRIEEFACNALSVSKKYSIEAMTRCHVEIMNDILSHA